MSTPPLSPQVFHILFALSEKERHGYDIMRQAEIDSGGRVAMGPGTLYGALKRLLEDGKIAESGERPDTDDDDERRNYYRLTDSGRAALTDELRRLDLLCGLARERDLLGGAPSLPFSA